MSTSSTKTNPKRERFIRLAEQRTNKVLAALRILGNCANRSQYEYTEKDVSEIFKAIRKMVSETEALFKQTTARRFKLPGS
ncbi:MAG: hypothetical protein K9W43_12660 [Candidatus Thorarchaeota archaeon]|nr:hypothetical protein [Candidatus Thorarchaeota archaeon]